jgi:hypothetical protein
MAINYVAYLNEEETEWVSYNWLVKPCETALVIWGYYILEWDLRKEVTKCKTREEVIEVFKNSTLPLSWRSSLENINNL